MTRLVHLVRHGEVDNPRHVVYASLPGFGLSARGKAQAAAAGVRLSRRPVGAVLSSPLDRAAETARIVAEDCGLDSRPDDRLTEWRLSEHWAGTAWDDLDRVFPGEVGAYVNDPVNLDFTPETLLALAQRMAAAVTGSRAATGDEDVVLVSHQDPIQAVRLFLTGGRLGSFHTDKPGHGSIVTLARTGPGGGSWEEAGYWEPPQGTRFPPIAAGEHGGAGPAR
jgi:broad specificity phosphatase PhoE